MSKNTHTSLLDGSMHPQKKSHGSRSLEKKHKKPFKSNITNKVKSRRVAQADVSDIESDDDGGGNGATEESATAEEDPDASALPGVRQPKMEGAVRRLAGHEFDDDDMFNDTNMLETTLAVAGAAEDGLDGDEDDYADVEDVSESDDDDFDAGGEEGVLRSAEKDLIEEFEKSEQRRNASLMTFDLSEMNLHNDEEAARGLGLLPESSFNDNEEFSFAVDMNEDPFYGFPKEGDEYQEMWGAAESTMWRMPDSARAREASDPTSATQKRVRFEETRSSSPSVSEDEDPNEAFPDLLESNGDLTASQSMSHDMYNDFMLSQQSPYNDNESVYDFEDEHEKLAFEIDEQSDSSDDSADDDSSHDSDDATDVETTEEQIAKLEERKRATGSSSAIAPTTPMSERRAVPKEARASSTPRPATPKSGKGPRTGTFEVDPTRAAIHTDLAAGQLTIKPPQQPLEKDKAFWQRVKTAVSSRDGSSGDSLQIMRSVSSDSMPARPFTAKSTLGSMFNGNLDFMRNNDTHGIAEDLFPTMMSRPETAFSSFTGTEDSDDDHGVDMDMQDFVHIDDSDSDNDAVKTGAASSPDDREMFGLERRNSDLLNHFTQNRGVIGSFRRNQHYAKHISSQASHPAQRASTHEYNALQKGRRGAANTPITPARKKRTSQDLTPSRGGVRKSVSSPLTSRRPRSRGNSLANADMLQTLAKSPFGE